MSAASIAALAAQWQAVAMDVLPKSLALFLLAGGALHLLRRASAAVRHLVWLLLLGGLGMLPLLAISLPAWRLPILPSSTAIDRAERPGAKSQAKVASPPPGAAFASSPVPEHAASAGRADERPFRPAQVASEPSFPPGTSTRTVAPIAPAQTFSFLHRRPQGEGRARSVSANRLSIVPIGWSLLWLLGFVLTLGRTGVGLICIGRAARQARPTPEAFQAYAAVVLGDSLPPWIRLRLAALANRTLAPMTWGLLRPVVLLPAQAVAWPQERLRAVLLHERAHIQRGDWLTQLLARGVCACYWFHPLVWWAAHHLRRESERACDDCVLATGMKAPDYANQLLEVVRAMKTSRSTLQTALMMAQPSQIEGRIRTILDPRRNRRPMTRRVGFVAVAIAVGLLAPLAMVQVEAKPSASPSKPPAVPRHHALIAPPAVGAGAVSREEHQAAPHPSDAAAPRAPGPASGAEGRPPALIATLHLAKTTFRPGESITVTYTVRNKTTQPVTLWLSGFWPNHRILVHDATGAEPLLTAAGKLRRAAFQPAGQRDKNAPYLLPPGKIYNDGLQHDLNTLYTLPPGRYTVEILYDDRQPPTPLRITTEPVTFTILAVPGREQSISPVQIETRLFRAASVPPERHRIHLEFPLSAGTVARSLVSGPIRQVLPIGQVLSAHDTPRLLNEVGAGGSPTRDTAVATAGKLPTAQELQDRLAHIDIDRRLLKESFDIANERYKAGITTKSDLNELAAKKSRLDLLRGLIQRRLTDVQAGKGQDAFSERRELQDRLALLKLDLQAQDDQVATLKAQMQTGEISPLQLEEANAQKAHRQLEKEQIERRLQALNVR